MLSEWVTNVSSVKKKMKKGTILLDDIVFDLSKLNAFAGNNCNVDKILVLIIEMP